MMEFESSRFGTIAVDDDTVITMPGGVLGFPEVTRYVVLEHDKGNSPFKWLQAVGNPTLAFVVIDPLNIVENYRFSLDGDTIKMTGSSDLGEYGAMLIVNIPGEDPAKMTVNMRAPIVVHLKSRMGRQVVLEDETMPLNYNILTQEARAAN